MRVCSRSRPQAFTLVELLVVIAIIGILIALLLPAVQKVREAANRTQCSNNLKQIGLALHGYHDAFQTFPNANTPWNPNPTFGSMFTSILPYLEQTAIARQYDTSVDSYSNPLANTPLAIFRCPSMAPATAAPTYIPGWSSYAASVGTTEVWFTPPPDDGVIVRNNFYGTGNCPGVRIADITDGTSDTFVIGEMGFELPDCPCYDASGNPIPGTICGGLTWWANGYAGGSYGNTQLLLNTITPNPANPYDLYDRMATFRGDHSGGVFFLFADGSVHFLANTITLTTYQALGTRAGGEVVSGDF